MKTAIVYFSGTGNTDFVAHYLHDHLKKKGIDSELFSIEQIDPGDLDKFDTLICGFPVYGLHCPKNILDFFEKLPEDQPKKIFLFSTAGYMIGNAFRHTFKFFPKSYSFMGSAFEMMPGSDGLSFMKKDSGYAKKALSRDFSVLKKSDSLIEKICEENAKPKSLSFSLLGFLFGWLVIWGMNMSEKNLRKNFYATDACTRCKLCEKSCPTNNITVSDSGVSFSDKCMLCMRCIHQCPSEAIQIGKGTVGKFRWKGPGGKFKAIQIAAKHKS